MLDQRKEVDSTVKNITQHVGRGSIALVRSHGNLHLSDLSFTYVRIFPLAAFGMIRH